MNILERFIKPKETSQQVTQRIMRENEELRIITAQYLEGKMSLEEYQTRSKNLNRINLREMARKLRY